MMDQLKRDSSPLNFNWEDDNDYKSKLDLMDPFLEGCEHSLGNDESIDFSAAISSGPAGGEGIKRPITIDVDSRKRSDGSQLSDFGTRRKKKPKGMPKRPLSAYNLFFQSERFKILEIARRSSERISFEGLAKIIGKRWQELTSKDRNEFERLARKDTDRYRQQMESYNQSRQKRTEDERKNVAASGLELSVVNNQETQPEKDRVVAAVKSSALPPATPLSTSTTIEISTSKDDSRLHNSAASQVPPYPFEAVAPTTARSELESPARASTTVPASYSALQTADPNIMMFDNFSVPPTPPNAERLHHPGAFHMPPGMEIVLSDRTGQDRKYRVQYACYTMTRDEARKYIDSVSGAPCRQQMIPSQLLHQPPQPFHQPPQPFHQPPQNYLHMQHEVPSSAGVTMGAARGPPHE
jgi:HMG (high mobility group) box